MSYTVKCGTFGASATEDRHIATGDHAGKLNIYDLERISTPVFSQQAHTSIINAIDGCGGLEIGKGAPEIVTGGRDGCVRLWDPRVSGKYHQDCQSLPQPHSVHRAKNEIIFTLWLMSCRTCARSGARRRSAGS
jgi:WD40 repeat protein